MSSSHVVASTESSMGDTWYSSFKGRGKSKWGCVTWTPCSRGPANAPPASALHPLSTTWCSGFASMFSERQLLFPYTTEEKNANNFWVANVIRIGKPIDQRWETTPYPNVICSVTWWTRNGRPEQGSFVKILVCWKVSIPFSSFALCLIFTDWENEMRWKINSACWLLSNKTLGKLLFWNIAFFSHLSAIFFLLFSCMKN